ncbi:MAG TPA: conjugal transfer protein TraI, partial [Hyphomonadaceae bacterium]|nr:conjugal transfer protein TraI [Hyphomonadaceae bacterium]
AGTPDDAIGASSRGAFLASQRGDDARLDARLTPPRSRYELIAGAVIPAALVTELNSDLPGRAIAQVTVNVYDSVTGEHLLIPQGSRLLGAYDSANSHGDRRLLLVWNRLVFPNGWSIGLRGMEGTDPSGASGLRDQVDNHLDRLAGAIGLSAIISVIADNAEDDDEQSLSQSVGDAAAAEAARTGGRIVDRELSVRPTLRIRAGGAVRVLVTRDIQLRPYR